MNEADLGKMTMKELLALRDRVDAAIRAGIARSRAPLGQQQQQSGAPAVFDLERERDAWKSWRK